MHYDESFDDGTCLGLFDGSRPAGALSEGQLWAYHEQVAKREHPATRGHALRLSGADWPRSAIDHARIRTALISVYRIHPRRYFFGGDRFPQSWPPREKKIDIRERYSPRGEVGYYFGLTVDAALDEARHSEPAIDPESDPSKILVVFRSYYRDLLYLTPALPAVWALLGLPEMPVWEMYLAVMDARTGNDVTDRIGCWAREEGFKGIVYPSARYGQRIPKDGAQAKRFPALNLVELGSHLCEQGIAAQMTINALITGLEGVTASSVPMIVFSEPNMVIFDEDIVSGRDRPVFYSTYNPEDARLVKSSDEREGLKRQISWFCDERGAGLCIDNPEYRYVVHPPARGR